MTQSGEGADSQAPERADAAIEKNKNVGYDLRSFLFLSTPTPSLFGRYLAVLKEIAPLRPRNNDKAIITSVVSTIYGQVGRSAGHAESSRASAV